MTKFKALMIAIMYAEFESLIPILYEKKPMKVPSLSLSTLPNPEGPGLPQEWPIAIEFGYCYITINKDRSKAKVETELLVFSPFELFPITPFPKTPLY